MIEYFILVVEMVFIGFVAGALSGVISAKMNIKALISVILGVLAVGGVYTNHQDLGVGSLALFAAAIFLAISLSYFLGSMATTDALKYRRGLLESENQRAEL